MKPVEYLGTIFFDLMRIQPRETFYSTSLSLARAIVNLDKRNKADNNEDYSINDKYLKTLDEISKKTHKDLNLRLAKAEAIVASKDRSQWNITYEGKDNFDTKVKMPNGKSVTVMTIYMLLKESYTPVVDIVVDILKPYTMEFRETSNDSGMFSPSWLGGNNEAKG